MTVWFLPRPPVLLPWLVQAVVFGQDLVAAVAAPAGGHAHGVPGGTGGVEVLDGGAVAGKFGDGAVPTSGT